MNILDQLYILFKSNSKEAQKDTADLDKSLDELAKKNAKRDDQEKKSDQDRKKRSDQAIKDTKEYTDVTKSLTGSVVDFGLSAVNAYASFSGIKEGIINTAFAYATFSGIKKGITDAIEYNSQLEKTKILSGENANTLAVWAAAVEKLGVSQQTFLGWYTSKLPEVLKAGGDPQQIIKNLQNYVAEIDKTRKKLGEGAARQQFATLAQQGLVPFEFYSFMHNPDELKNALEAAEKTIASTDKTADAARRIEAAFSEASDSARAFFTENEDLVEGFAHALKGIADTIRTITKELRGVADIFYPKPTGQSLSFTGTTINPQTGAIQEHFGAGTPLLNPQSKLNNQSAIDALSANPLPVRRSSGVVNNNSFSFGDIKVVSQTDNPEAFGRAVADVHKRQFQESVQRATINADDQTER